MHRIVSWRGRVSRIKYEVRSRVGSIGSGSGFERHSYFVILPRKVILYICTYLEYTHTAFFAPLKSRRLLAIWGIYT